MPAKYVCQFNSFAKCSHAYCTWRALHGNDGTIDQRLRAVRAVAELYADDDMPTPEPRALAGVRVA